MTIERKIRDGSSINRSTLLQDITNSVTLKPTWEHKRKQTFGKHCFQYKAEVRQFLMTG